MNNFYRYFLIMLLCIQSSPTFSAQKLIENKKEIGTFLTAGIFALGVAVSLYYYWTRNSLPVHPIVRQPIADQARQVEQEQAAEQVRQEQARQAAEQARRARLEQARQVEQEQARQEQARRARQEQARQARQEQARQARQVEQEQARQNQVRQAEQARLENQARQEQLRQDQARQNQVRQENQVRQAADQVGQVGQGAQALNQIINKMEVESRKKEARDLLYCGIANRDAEKVKESLKFLTQQGIININSSLLEWRYFRDSRELPVVIFKNDELLGPEYEKKYSLLHLAVLNNRESDVKFFLDCGADPELCLRYENSWRDDSHETNEPTPLALAMAKKNNERLLGVFAKSMQKKLEEQQMLEEPVEVAG